MYLVSEVRAFGPGDSRSSGRGWSGAGSVPRRDRRCKRRSGLYPQSAGAGFRRGIVRAWRLPFEPPIEPMLAKAADALPDGDGWLFEPKWDGFRALVFRDGDEVYIQSRDLKPLDRYFPELADAAARRAAGALRPRRRGRDRAATAALDFEALLLRIHPGRVAGRDARRRVAGVVRRVGPARARRRGPAATPAGRAPGPARERSLGRRDAAGPPDAGDARSRARPPTGSTGSRAPASTAWSPSGSTRPTSPASGRCSRSSTSARPTASSPASAGTRTGPGRTSARCCSACSTTRARSTTSASRRRSRWDRRAELVGGARAAARGRARGPPVGGVGRVGGRACRGRRASGCPARRRAGTGARTCRWEPLRPERVVEVAYDHLQGDRFRHGDDVPCAGGPDKQPADCRYDQLEATAPYELAEIFGAGD